MDWQGQRESENVENRGGISGTGMAIGGGGIGALLIAAVLYFAGIDPSGLFTEGPPAHQGPPTAEEKSQEHFVKVVLASTEDVWTKLFKDMGKTYAKPKLVLFHGKVESACGLASSAVGPFYCPGDKHVYLDLEFFAELRSRFKAPGEFAEAYVIAHEVGHHVQNLLGVSGKVHAQEQSASKLEKNHLSVRLELQADFLAGIWGHYAKDQFKLNSADLESALVAAKAIGDDQLQKKATGTVRPDAFTHGTSAQRVYWFRMGFDSGNVQLMEELFRRGYNEL